MQGNNTRNDLQAIIAHSKELAVLWKHGFIHYDHLFVAMLHKKCMASPYLTQFDAEMWAKKTKGVHAAKSTISMNSSLPLTIQAENVLKHAHNIAKVNNRQTSNSIDLLLAILWFENDIKMAFDAAGMIVEDIPGCPDKKTISQKIIKPIRQEAYSKLELMFLSSKSKENKVEELYENARSLYTYDQIDDSVRICKIGLGISASNVDLKRLLAYCYIKKRDFEPAITIMTEMVKEHPEMDDLWFTLSYLFDEVGRYAEAGSILTKLDENDADNESYLNNRGFNLFRQGRYAEAVPFFEKAIEVDPTSAYPYNNLGFSKYKLGDTNTALALIKKSLELDGGNSFAYKHRGIIFMEQGNREEALKNFNIALKYKYTEKYGDEVLQLLKSMG